MNFYVRATGDNQFAGGTDKWLKVRGMKEELYAYILEVRFNGQRKFVAMQKNQPTYNLEFAEGWPGLKPVSYMTVVKGMK